MKQSIQTLSLLGTLCLATAASGQLIRTGFTDNTLTANDDGSTGLVSIGFDVNFFGTTYGQLYVNNNGNVTFDAALSTYSPFDLTSNEIVIIAPFFGDVDTRSVNSGKVTYGTGTVDGRDAFGVNYLDVGVYQQIDIFNSFQMVLIDRSDTGVGNFDIEFNYEEINWEAGTASGAGNDGLGGSAARAGYSNGDDTSFEIPGSATNGAFLDSNLTTGLIHTSNIGVDGRWLFEVREGAVIDDPDDRPNPQEPVIPEPSAVGFLALSGLLLAFVRRRR